MSLTVSRVSLESASEAVCRREARCERFRHWATLGSRVRTPAAAFPRSSSFLRCHGPRLKNKTTHVVPSYDCVTSNVSPKGLCNISRTLAEWNKQIPISLVAKFNLQNNVALNDVIVIYLQQYSILTTFISKRFAFNQNHFCPQIYIHLFFF